MKKIIFLLKNTTARLGIILGFVAFAVVNHSCKHDNFKEFVGEGICPSKDFALIQPFSINSNNLNLISDTLKATAVFNSPAKWTLTLTGLTSGAKKTFSDKSSSVDVKWYGEPGSFTFFQNEDVKVEFNIQCREALSVVNTITIMANNFENYGHLISDFEGNGVTGNAQWATYTTGLPFSVKTTPLTGPVGTGYLGASFTPTGWWSGGVYPTQFGSLSSLPTTNADSIYFNIFIYGNNTTSLTISLTGGGGPYNKTIDLGSWSGWKYFSFKLTDFVTSGGVKVSNPLLITGMEFGFGPSKAAGDYTEFNVDFILFTPYKPFISEQ